MLMAFVGFRGIVSSQLDDLASRARAVEMLTTNGTALLAGFYLFLAYCLFAMATTHRLERDIARCQVPSRPQPH